MKKLFLLALALGSLAVACAPGPTVINLSTGTAGQAGSDAGGEGGVAGDGAGASAGSSGSAGMGGEGGSAVQGPTPRDIYMQEVHPSIVDTCGSCHQTNSAVSAPEWMDIDPATSYELSKAYNGIVVDPSSDSLIINKPAHEGPALTDTQKGLVIKWIDAEIKAGTVDPGSTNTGTVTQTPTDIGKTTEQMLAEFGKCMNYDLWLSKGMDKFPDQQTTLGPCKSCHNQGLGGTYLSADPQMTFDANTKMPFILRMVLPVYEGAKPVDLAPSLRFEQKGTEQCNNANPDLCHPKYNLTPENVAAFEGFVGGTLQKWQANACQ